MSKNLKFNTLVLFVAFFAVKTASAEQETAQSESTETSPSTDEAADSNTEEKTAEAPVDMPAGEEPVQEQNEEDIGEEEDEAVLKVAESETTDEQSEDRAAKALGALEKEPGFDVEARLFAQWIMRDELYQPLHEFRISMARVELSWTQWKLIEALVEMDLDQLFEGREATALLRDLYIQIKPFRWLGVRVGQFKRPFSRIELRSRRRLQVIDRGVANDFIIDELLYGGRDIGMEISGRIIKSIKLDYAIGVFNGMGMNADELGSSGFKDISARLQLKPVKWLSFGVNGSVKFIEDDDLRHFIRAADFTNVDPDDYPPYVDPGNPEGTELGFIADHKWMTGPRFMAGADTALSFGKLRIIAEGMFGENWWFKKYPYIWSAALIASYKLRLKQGWPLYLEPVLMGEVLALLRNTAKWRNRMWRITPGVNLHIGNYVRIMVNGEFIITEGDETDIDGSTWTFLWPNEWPGNWIDTQRLLIQFAFAI